jgi:hypothetical protein
MSTKALSKAEDKSGFEPGSTDRDPYATTIATFLQSKLICFKAGLQDFSLHNIPKRGKYTKITK